jgi:molybdopterin/thiamine biosynthesis adenylyltransferase
MDEKYLRNIDSITEKEQDLLKFKAVTIIGCGGLGQSLLNLLCRLGI